MLKREELAVGAKPPRPPAQERSPYLLLFLILIASAVLTWLIPAGEFEYQVRDGIKFAVADSLHSVPQQGVWPLAVFTAIADGVIHSAPIIFLIMFTGGALAVVEKTGAIEAALSSIAHNRRLKDYHVVLIFGAVFALLGTTGIVVNAVVAFVPIGLLVARSLGLSPMFGTAIVYLTCAAGFNTAVLNPATTGLTQRLAQLPLFSGMLFRSIICLLFVITAIVFIIAYTWRCRKTAQKEVPLDAPAPEKIELTAGHKRVLVVTFLSLAGFIYGVIAFKWAEEEMIAMFLLLTALIGILCRFSGAETINAFLSGCSRLVKGAFIVGMARAISLVLQHGKVLDPIVGFMSDLLAPLHPALAAVGMYISAALMHLAISSGSGESALLVPIYTPIGDAIGLTRQITVQAILLGEGIVNCISPTSGVLMAVLATANISFGKWLRFVAPLIAVWFVICVIALIVAEAINWGPF